MKKDEFMVHAVVDGENRPAFVVPSIHNCISKLSAWNNVVKKMFPKAKQLSAIIIDNQYRYESYQKEWAS